MKQDFISLNKLKSGKYYEKLVMFLRSFMSVILERVPKRIIEKPLKGIEKIKNEFRSKIKTIPEAKDNYIGVFTDGSSTVSERRGAGVAVISAVSIRIQCENNSFRVEEKLEIPPENGVVILIPRMQLTARANTLMRAIEYLIAADAAKKGCDIIAMDGSYITTLLAPYTAINSSYNELLALLDKAFGGKKNATLVFIRFAQDMEEIVNKRMDDIFSYDDGNEILSNFLKNHYKIIDEILNKTESEVPEDLRIIYQNYITIFVEENFAIRALIRLFRIAEEQNALLFWISKDSESRMLTRRYPLLSLANDLSVLDLVLENNQYVNVEELVTLPIVSLRRASLDLNSIDELTEENVNKIMNQIYPAFGRMYSVYAVTIKHAKQIYEKYNKYSAIYAKYRDFVIQITYPTQFFEEYTKRNGYKSADKVVEKLLGMLKTISPRGYPEPLVHAHFATILSRDLAEKMANGLEYSLKMAGKDDKNLFLLANIIGDMGRKRIGI